MEIPLRCRGDSGSNQKINGQINSVFHRNIWNGPNIITSSHIIKCVCSLIFEFFSINMFCYSTSSVVGWICQYGTMDTGMWILLMHCVLGGSTVHHNSESLPITQCIWRSIVIWWETYKLWPLITISAIAAIPVWQVYTSLRFDYLFCHHQVITLSFYMIFNPSKL